MEKEYKHCKINFTDCNTGYNPPIDCVSTMDKYEVKEHRLQKEAENLKKDLKEVFKKYDISLHESNQWDDIEGVVTHTNYYFVLGRRIYYSRNVNEILNECLTK